jgi:5-methylcytosine-specific restriction enzyme A
MLAQPASQLGFRPDMPRSTRASAAQRGYGAKWREKRAEFLRANPWCVFCLRVGRRTAATIVDHVKPHRGDMHLFWDPSNWQGLCEPHHNSAKAILEGGGSVGPVGRDGVPLDPSHPWARQRLAKRA